MDTKKILKQIISGVNTSFVKYGFEENMFSLERTQDHDSKERCKTLEQYIEIRFNRECFKIPELTDLMTITEGKLFECKEIVDPDLKKRKFKSATITVNRKLLPTKDENLIDEKELDEILEFLNWSEIKFNSVKKKIRLSIYD